VNMVTRKLLGAFTHEPWRGDILAAFGLDRKP